jgi:hypothetical protein
VSTPQSQNLDAAALYFLEDAGRGGFGGYLGSNSDDNEFLLSPKLKMLVGYPVDGIATANQGRMHATPASKVTFAQSYGHTFTTSDISSSGGNSGGPLCVQFDDGIYYPAAIYLGGSAQTVVRAIDTDVIDLFDRAEVSGNGGGNNTSGGISQVNTPVSGAVFAAASLKVDILPAAASGEATWKLSSSGTAWDSGKQLDTLAPGDYTLSYTPVTGFLTPPSASITLTAGNLSSITQTYDGITAQPSDRTVAVGGSATFTVGVSGTPTAYQWRRDGFNITGATAATYTLSNATLADSGNYRVVVTWSDGAQTSSAATLSVTEAVAKPWAVTGTGMFQGGGHAGLLWFNATTRETAIWLMNGLTAEGTASYAPGSDWSVVGTGDFDGDGQTDLLWRNAATGGVVIWFMNGTSIASSKWIYDSGTTWVPCQLADFNGDGKTDILWHNTVTGDYAIWLMNGSDALLGASGFAVAPGWQITQVADFDGDGKADLLWRNSTTGGVVLWFMNGTAIAGSKWIYDSGLSWTPAYIADFNGDGKADILWQNTDGSQAIWLMNGTGELLGASGFSVAAGWQVALVADFDGDGKADLLWRNSTTGGVVLWTMNGTSVANTAWVYNDGPSLTPVRAADFNGDGKADLLWQGTDGSLAIWLMNGGTCLSSAGVY